MLPRTELMLADGQMRGWMMEELHLVNQMRLCGEAAEIFAPDI